MSFSVTTDMVKKLEVSDGCLESYPCRHHCKIVLNDGREKTVTIRGPNVSSLIGSVASEKIQCPWSKDHFSYPSVSKDNADDILTRAFKPIDL